ncbi:MAG: hypothetical protein KTR35_15485, partial [Gammaproteobacteria bacterium]|nr:hypothetical protein [Gammaproteobacteria bacterium]
MQYENRQPTEGVNVSKEHPLKRFGQLLLSAAVLVVMLVVVFQFLGGAIARMVPLSYEVAAVEKIEIPLGDNAAHPEIASYLIDLANRLLPHLDVPEDVEIAVHYGHDDVFN